MRLRDARSAGKGGDQSGYATILNIVNMRKDQRQVQTQFDGFAHDEDSLSFLTKYQRTAREGVGLFHVPPPQY